MEVGMGWGLVTGEAATTTYVLELDWSSRGGGRRTTADLILGLRDGGAPCSRVLSGLVPRLFPPLGVLPFPHARSQFSCFA